MMNNNTESILIAEVKQQAEYAVLSYNFIINTPIVMINSKKDRDMFWLHISNFLNSTAIISKILWGNKNNYNEREGLRNSLNINDEMFIRDRDIRNNFEHIDNKVIKWSEESTDGNFIDRNITTGIKSESIDAFRNYDIRKKVITFNDLEYPVIKICQELMYLLNQIENYFNSKDKF